MGRVYLCGHTGCVNRGCDAIVRSTADILRALDVQDISLLTFAVQQDRQLQLDTSVQLVPYPKKPPYMRAASMAVRKITGNGVWGQRYLHRPLMQQAKKHDMIFNIGGDTYCYGKPYISYALNEMAMEKGIPTVFWGCSVDERLHTDAQMRKDVNRYSHIVARESLSYEILRQAVDDPQKVYLACDPAFTLEPEETHLPEGFTPGNTVGINISPLVCENENDPDDGMYQNVFYLIDYILKTSDMGVCLIPHVYDPVCSSADSKVLGAIYSKYSGNSRVSRVCTVLNSRQLKYIISQCRFFIGARTHAMIAAYSSGIPALALSYSVKSLGIARDIFGSAEGFAVPWRDITRPEQLCDAFVCVLQEQEEWIIQRYGEVMQNYRARIVRTAREIIRHQKE